MFSTHSLSRRAFIKNTITGLGMFYGASLLSGCSLPWGNTKWTKYDQNPVFGPGIGTVFDVSVLKEDDRYRMWFSWRDNDSIGLTESADGIKWSDPTVVLAPAASSNWEQIVNRPYVLKREDGYHLWYTGQTDLNSCLGYAKSADGIHWERSSDQPVLKPEKDWEKTSVMCPSVLYDENSHRFRLWYSGGEQNEPNEIGYATSSDGIQWTRSSDQPIFKPNPDQAWESVRTTGCQVLLHQGWHVMFYIGFDANAIARIGLARSRDGITGWQRHPRNPILSADADTWDSDSVYKPFAILDDEKWKLWYNGRSLKNKFKYREQIGLATYPREDLGFDE
jgi:predicted GH43/DUF377 family glycosyl hydrolase